MNPGADILLVSGSPRRRELLDMIGVRYQVYAADIDEDRSAGEPPEAYVNRLARGKALAGLAYHKGLLPALGADTAVVLDGEILCKPADRDTARRMLRKLSGRTHDVLSAVALAMPSGEVLQDMNRTRVTFGSIPSLWIDRYAEHDEPMDKAGAYAIQGLAGQWVSHIDGSYSSVMGLPVFETARMLRKAGIDWSLPGLSAAGAA